MADRRMFSKRIVNSARFLKLPISSQALYFHLGLHADDDGIVEAYNVIKSVGCSEDDLKVLVLKGFVKILNEDLVSYITDWTENNRIRADRKIDSIYKDLLISIIPDIELIEPKERADVKKKRTDAENKLMDVQWTSNGQPMDGIGKDRLGKDSLGKVKSKETFVSVIDGYTQDEELKDALKGYVEMRQKQKGFTVRALKLNLNKLNEIALDDYTKTYVVNQSIEHGWKSFYPMQNNNRKDDLPF